MPGRSFLGFRVISMLTLAALLLAVASIPSAHAATTVDRFDVSMREYDDTGSLSRPPGARAPTPARSELPAMHYPGASFAPSLDFVVPRGTAGAVKRTVSISQRNLQKGFTKHGADFGLSGNWNPGKAAEFGQAIRQHVSSPGVRVIEGSYRGNPVTHFVDTKTGLNVIVNPAGNYVSGWRLGAEQLEGVLSSGRLF